ncbi:MAG TPA: DoxX family protein [Planctomycetes bacterium]|nr:DoxX family protein [Planctomycetota bacterium]
MNKRKRDSQDIALLIVRLALAAVFVFHGTQKMFGWFDGPGLDGTAAWMASVGLPLPKVSAILAGSTETLGGLALLLGVLARTASVLLALTMAVAATTLEGFDSQAGGMEYPLVLLSVLVLLATTGAGRLSVRPSRPREVESA